MGLRKKKTLLEQAEGYVEAAIDQARDFVQDTARPAIADAREKAAPVVAASAATLADKAGEARAKPVVAWLHCVAGTAVVVECGLSVVLRQGRQGRQAADKRQGEYATVHGNSSEIPSPMPTPPG